MNKKIEYYKRHCELLEKQLFEEKHKNTELEIQLLFYKNANQNEVDETKKLLKSCLASKQIYDGAMDKLRSTYKQLSDALSEINCIYPEYKSKTSAITKSLRKSL